MSTEPTTDQSANQPDPLFKRITGLAAELLGLVSEPTERPYTPRADLILRVPPGVSLENTLFDFFRRVNVVEFKGEADPLTLEKYVRNHVRTDLWFLDNQLTAYEDILNVIVTSRQPQSFFNYAVQRNVHFQQAEGRSWLWQAQVGLQDVAIVVCRLLPLEERYYPWLAFAPAATIKWREYLARIWRENNRQYLELAEDLYPEDFKMLTEEFNKRLGELLKEPGLVQPRKRDLRLTAEIVIEEIEQDEPDLVPEILALFKPEERLSGLKPEERLSGLKPEERLSGLQPEEMAESLSEEQKEALLKLLQAQTKNKQSRKKPSDQ